MAAALAKQPREAAGVAHPATVAPAGPLIQILTMNGFTILESEDVSHMPGERRFKVRSPKGDEHEVVIQIDDEVIGYVERMTRRKLPAESSFWTGQAQRTLSDYLWNEGKAPPARRLVIKNIDRDDLPIAARWKDD